MEEKTLNKNFSEAHCKRFNADSDVMARTEHAQMIPVYSVLIMHMGRKRDALTANFPNPNSLWDQSQLPNTQLLNEIPSACGHLLSMYGPSTDMLIQLTLCLHLKFNPNVSD